MKLSLAETLAVVAWVALNIAGLTSNATISWIATSVNFVLVVACAISALVAQGSHRAYAIAFLVPVILYCGIVVTISDYELTMKSGRLPTSRFFQSLLKPDYENGLTGAAVIQRGRHAESLMPCGHSAIAVAIGFIAGKYGRYINSRTKMR